MDDGRLSALAFVPYVVVGVLQIASKVFEHGGLDQVTRPLLMPMLMLPMLVLAHRGTSRAVTFLTAGIVMSWLGDVTLQWFIVGLACFLTAHVAYLVALRAGLQGPTSRVAIGAAVMWWAVLLLALWPYLGPLAGPVAVYGAALVAMAAMATRGGFVVGAGGVAFVLSDTGLAFRTFSPWLHGHVADVVIMGLYVVAQGLIVFGMVGRLLNVGQPSAR